MHNRKRAYGTTEISRLCHVTPPTVGRWIEEGKLPCFTTGGGHRRVWDDDLLAFIRSHNIPVPPELSSFQARRVLIVDDDASARRVIARQVSQLDPSAEVHGAAAGFEAGRKLTLLRPELVLLDWRLPGIDGLRVCRMIRADASLRGIRILAISGYSLEETRKECLKAGADDFLGKPFQLAELSRKLAKLLPSESPRPKT
jgi:excisionase family DNA binding protein